jgi:pilus assembly protein Flp/PilA
MRTLVHQLSRWALWRQRHGQDLIEYALMAGLVAVSAVAVMPGYAKSISQIFSKANSVLSHQSGS